MKSSNCLTWEKYAGNSKTKSLSAKASNDFHCSCGFITTTTTTTIDTIYINTIITPFEILI